MLMLSTSRRKSLPVLYYCCASSIVSRAAAFSRTMSSSSILGKTQVSVQDAISLHSDLKFIDGTWWLDKARNGRQEFETGPRIANARYLDIDDISSKMPDNLPHMMPPAALQSSAMDVMGIQSTDHVVVYGRDDCMFVTRAYMQMRIMGHPKELCHLLDGSLEEWVDAGGPIEEEGCPPSQPLVDASSLTSGATPTYQATEAQNIVSMDDLKTWIDEGKTMGENPEILVVDARSKGRFEGTAPEPRPGLRGGRMPGSINLPIIDLLDPSNKVRFKPKDELEQILKDSGIPLGGNSSSKIVSSCGSGVTACAIMTALDILDEDSSNVYLYDGAWTQWGGQPDTPIVKGE
mmetsp:Transcript_2058/g.4294  ORF Transcript_2058/g.4294 Transcript_2058/m.4294 type:complete len:348 (-) Transcript_2058:783-1826(-)